MHAYSTHIEAEEDLEQPRCHVVLRPRFHNSSWPLRLHEDKREMHTYLQSFHHSVALERSSVHMVLCDQSLTSQPKSKSVIY